MALITAFSLFAAVRVFLFSAAFPFFNNVDEHAHVDLVRKYARGYWPRQPVEKYDEESGLLFALLGSYEYMLPLDRFPGGVVPPPPWKRDPEAAARAMRAEAAQWARVPNFEAHAPPVYYVVAAAWYRLGGLLGLEGGEQLYFLRFMNVGVIALVVWLAWWFARLGFPDRPEMRIGVPMLAACVPQDLFYSVNSDVLSAPLFTLGLILLLAWNDRPRGAWLGGLAGLAAGLTFLVKYSNIALPLILVLVLSIKLSRIVEEKGWPAAILNVSPAIVGAVLPVAAWLGRNHALLGDWLGSAAKIAHLGWTPRPLGELFAHPIFTPAGLWTFWDGLMATFWRGELVWHLEPLAQGAMDRFYSFSALLLLVVSGACLILRRNREGRPLLFAVTWLSWLLSLGFLVLLSVAFDFGGSYYPSREHPFFTSGRLISGALVPFLVLYVHGAACLLRPVARISGTIVLVSAICLLMLASEIVLTMPLFENPYNWFHLG